MSLKDDLELFKQQNKDTVEYIFKNGTKFKGASGYWLYNWLDILYIDAVKEYQQNKTQHLVSFIKSLL